MFSAKYLGHAWRFGLLSLIGILSGCDWVLFNPKGQIGQDEKDLLITAVLLMLLVVIPVIVMTVMFAWKYRASVKARYEPNWAHSTAVEVVVWSIPCLIIIVLSVLTWRSTHELDPYKPLVSDKKPITIEAVSMDWKWLFIYPEFGIATVNEIAFPLNTPVDFKITSDTVMNSFFIPQLGSQIYSMAGMVTSLHLIANEAGQYAGISSNYSGHGFSKMRFTARALAQQSDFDQWVATVKSSQTMLDAERLKTLEANRNVEEVYPVTYYGHVDNGIFASIVDKYMTMPAEHHPATLMHHGAMHLSLGEDMSPRRNMRSRSINEQSPLLLGHSGDLSHAR